ncbi:acylamino-acid-releasing enzyme-like isoform X1 [Mytilus californianus]|uniref:acylamino-acid-releasing enzyme-like isoform X1 n=1 Tax=Mytilus californianus TaxID=6549 RepID=UPI0022472C71|nr:acylamino-acid-releasing enzyme-like isoform X1 [Mytilus californianus]
MRKIEEVISLYRKYGCLAEPLKGYISNQSKGDNLTLKTHWKQTDLERIENIKFSKNYIVRNGRPYQYEVQSTNIVTENNELWNKESPSGRLNVIIRNITTKKEEEKQYIEIWDDRQKIKNYNITSLEKHGKICDPDGQFGSVCWSASEKNLLYIAEKKKLKTVSYFDSKPNKDDKNEEEKPVKGQEHDYIEDWGEQLVGKTCPVVCILDIDNGDVKVLDNILDNHSLGQAVWAPSDSGVVFTGWKNGPYRLGLIYCPIRESAIYYWDTVSNKCERLSDDTRCSALPRFSPDGSKLIYFDNDIGGPHYQCARLLMCDWPSRQTSVIVDIVKEPTVKSFPGFYVASLPTKCWSADNRRIILSSFWRSSVALVVVDVKDKTVTRLKTNVKGDAVLMDVLMDKLLVKCSALNQPPYLAISSLPAAGQEGEITVCPLDEPIPVPGISWEVQTFSPTDRPHSKFGALNYETILVMPEVLDVKPPLIVFPHGGPHSVFTEGYMLYTSCLIASGFAVLYINYRGSLGFGDNNLRSLPGNVGDQDVKDCQAAAEEVVSSGKVNGDKVVVFGGSHGGFLTAHLIGQYPKFYKAACCRNPVINLSTMVGSTDIPDWSFYESGHPFDHKAALNENILTDMWRKSPIRYIDQVEAPCLIMLGADDLRVPVKQGREFYRGLKARNKLTRLISYEGNSHPIIKTDSQADAFINMVEWFKKYLQ